MSQGAEVGETVGVPGLTDLDCAHLFDWTIETEPPQVFATPFGSRMTYVLRTGTCRGERLSGAFLPGGGDWATLGADGIGRLDVRSTLKADDAEQYAWLNSVVAIAVNGLGPNGSDSARVDYRVFEIL